MISKRQLLEDAIERLFLILDDIDGDPDLEPDPAEEQHDAEIDLTWINPCVPSFFVLAEQARRKAARGK